MAQDHWRAGPNRQPLHPADPRQIGAYQIQARLGAGGMGVVYLGRDTSQHPVAVKVIKEEFAQDPAFRARFRREVRAARRVAAYCTAPVRDADVKGERPYLVTDYITGPTLQQAVRAQGPLSFSEVQRLAAITAFALQAIHEAGVTHGDFTPANVLLSAVGPTVIDFGIATAADVTTGGLDQPPFGTRPYMTPEHFTNGEISPATDIFAWAGVIVFAATG